MDQGYPAFGDKKPFPYRKGMNSQMVKMVLSNRGKQRDWSQSDDTDSFLSHYNKKSTLRLPGIKIGA